MSTNIEYSPGLAGVPAAKTSVCYLDGTVGKLQYRGYPIEVLAEKSTFEETTYLLLFGKLPTSSELAAFDAELRAERGIADLCLAYAVRKLFANACRERRRNEHAADGGALLAGLLRHVPQHVLETQVPRLAVGVRIGTKHGRVQGVGLDIEARAALDGFKESTTQVKAVIGLAHVFQRHSSHSFCAREDAMLPKGSTTIAE